MMMFLKKGIIPALLLVCAFFAPSDSLRAQVSSGIMLDSVSLSGNSIAVEARISPNFFQATVTTDPGGVAYATIPFSKTIYVDASTGQYFDGQITTQSYDIPAGQVPVTNNGMISEALAFPTNILLPGTSYYFRVRIGGNYSTPLLYSSANTEYGTVPAQDNSDDGYFEVQCSVFPADGFTSTTTSVQIPCSITASSDNENPNMKIAYGLASEGVTTLGPVVLNTIMNVFQEVTFTASLSNLTAGEEYIFKLVKSSNPLIAYTPGQTFVVTASSSDTGGGSGGNTATDTPGGPMYGAADDTDFDSEEYANSLVKCNGTPTDPCRFQDFMELVQRILGFILVLMLPLSAIIFAYVGFLFLTSGGNAETKEKAKKVLWKALWGVILVLAAWLIVKTITSSLELDPEASLLDSTPL